MSAGGPLRVLLVEDTLERQEILQQLYRAHAWILATTGRRALTLLRAYEFDIVSLDFNLRGELTGSDVARGLLETRNRAARLIVHSMNPRGAEEIRTVLPDAILYPVSKMARTHEHLKRLRARIDQMGAAFTWELPPA